MKNILALMILVFLISGCSGNSISPGSSAPAPTPPPTSQFPITVSASNPQILCYGLCQTEQWSGSNQWVTMSVACGCVTTW